jgi:hypothetical protein
MAIDALLRDTVVLSECPFVAHPGCNPNHRMPPVQVAFLAECLGSTGALSGTSIVTYVLSKSGIDKEVDDAQEYVDSLKLVSGEDGIQALIPQMKKALKLSGDKISW